MSEDLDEPVIAADEDGVFVGTRRWLPEHLKGTELVGGLVVEGGVTYLQKPSGELVELEPGSLQIKHGAPAFIEARDE